MGFCLAAQKISAINAASAKTATITVNMIPVIVPSNWVRGVYMGDVGVGVGVMPAPHGNPVNLSLLNRGRQEEDMNRTVVTPETEAARNCPPSWLALTALSEVTCSAYSSSNNAFGATVVSSQPSAWSSSIAFSHRLLSRSVSLGFLGRDTERSM